MNQLFDTANINVTFVNIVLIARGRDPPIDEPTSRHRLYQRHLLQHRGGRARYGSSTRGMALVLYQRHTRHIPLRQHRGDRVR